MKLVTPADVRVEGFTFDTGALIALERRSRRMWAVWERALDRQVPITVPADVVAEWWRGQRGPIARLLDAVFVEPLTDALARTAGEALARCKSGPSTIDVIVVASAAARGDTVFTSDVADLDHVREVAFPSVRILGVGA